MGLLMPFGGRGLPKLDWMSGIQNFQTGASFTVPAPYGGLNLRDDITALQPNEARTLDNWFPSSGQLSMRPGFTPFATGMGSGEVKTLATFQGYSTSKLIAGANGKLFDCSTAGSATQLATGFTTDRWQTALYSNHLFFVNGTDTPQDYSAGTVGAANWTGSGLTATNLVNVALIRNRLWFCENNQAWVWYGGIGQIVPGAAPLTKFDLSQIASGGYCAAAGSASVDSGSGADDLTVFVMSTGEIIVYQGDPSTTFTLIGKYPGAPPIGRQCMIKAGGDLVIITTLGLLPISSVGTVAASQTAGEKLDLGRIDPWGKVAPAIAADAVLDSGNAGWHICDSAGVFYLTVPQTTGVLSKHYVLNTRTNAWATFSGWNGASLASFNNALYFGAETGGVVNLVGGSSDNGNDVTTNASGAFLYPTEQQNTNLFTALRPKLQSEGTVTGLLGVDVDFITRSLSGTSVPIVNDPSTTAWGSVWGSPWGAVADNIPLWYSVQGLGKAVSVRMRSIGQSQDLRWYATDVAYKPGGIR